MVHMLVAGRKVSQLKRNQTAYCKAWNFASECVVIWCNCYKWWSDQSNWLAIADHVLLIKLIEDGVKEDGPEGRTSI